MKLAPEHADKAPHCQTRFKVDQQHVLCSPGLTGPVMGTGHFPVSHLGCGENPTRRPQGNGSFHQVGARFVTVSIVTSVNAPFVILDYKCTFTVVLQIRMKSISPPSIGNYNNVN